MSWKKKFKFAFQRLKRWYLYISIYVYAFILTVVSHLQMPFTVKFYWLNQPGNKSLSIFIKMLNTEVKGFLTTSLTQYFFSIMSVCEEVLKNLLLKDMPLTLPSHWFVSTSKKRWSILSVCRSLHRSCAIKTIY